LIFPKLLHQVHLWQFTYKQQQAFLQDLAALIEDGVPASQAIDVIIEVSEGISKMVAQSVSSSLFRGQGLAEGMQPWFSHPVVEVIRVGEVSGALPQTLRAAADTYKDYSSTLSAFLSSVLYPLTVMVLALGMTVFIKNSVLTGFVEIKPLAEWPSVGQHLYNLGALVEAGWWLILLTIVLLAIIINNVLKNVTGQVRSWIDDVPLMSIYRSLLASRFMETLGVLLANGVVLKQALSTMQYEATPYLSWHLLQMEYHLSGGQENIAKVLDTNLISHADIVRLRVVARGKGFEQALLSLGRQARSRTSLQIERTGKIIGALLLMAGALIAVTIVFGIYTVGSTLV
jgi:type II secretory pathway component PulF